MLVWPAVIKYEGDDELTYLESLDALTEAHCLRFNPGVSLIDAAGKVFQPQQGHSAIEVPPTPEATLTLDSVIDLVRRHASVCGQCCIGKIWAPTIAEAIALVKSLEPR